MVPPDTDGVAVQTAICGDAVDALDRRFMRLALEQAVVAAESGEVPVGAALVVDDEPIACAGNAPVHLCDPSAHAEVRVLRAAGRRQGNYRLADATLYVTLEPCVMCVGAILHARVARVVFGAFDPAAGAVVSRHVLLAQPHHHAAPQWRGGVLEKQCRALLHDFFRARRSQHGEKPTLPASDG